MRGRPLRLVDLRQRLLGLPGAVRVGWSKVNLQGLVDQARAEQLAAAACRLRIENAARLVELGSWTREGAAEVVG